LAFGKASRVETRAPVATTGEEGIGDLRGVKHLFREDDALRLAGAFVALDGADSRRIVTGAAGSGSYRVTFRGPGGQAWADRGTLLMASGFPRSPLERPANRRGMYTVGE